MHIVKSDLLKMVFVGFFFGGGQRTDFGAVPSPWLYVRVIFDAVALSL